MAVNALKIRLGACDQMTLFGNIDLGASVGGVELNYSPTVFQVEVDQITMPFAAFKTKEEVTFDVALVQIQMNLVAIAFGYASPTTTGITTTAAGTISTAGAPVVTPVGGAAVTYTYQWVAFTSAGDGIPSANGTTAAGPTTLSPTTYNSIARPAVV